MVGARGVILYTLVALLGVQWAAALASGAVPLGIKAGDRILASIQGRRARVLGRRCAVEGCRARHDSWWGYAWLAGPHPAFHFAPLQPFSFSLRCMRRCDNEAVAVRRAPWCPIRKRQSGRLALAPSNFTPISQPFRPFKRRIRARRRPGARPTAATNGWPGSDAGVLGPNSGPRARGGQCLQESLRSCGR